MIQGCLYTPKHEEMILAKTMRLIRTNEAKKPLIKEKLYGDNDVDSLNSENRFIKEDPLQAKLKIRRK